MRVSMADGICASIGALSRNVKHDPFCTPIPVSRGAEQGSRGTLVPLEGMASTRQNKSLLAQARHRSHRARVTGPGQRPWAGAPAVPGTAPVPGWPLKGPHRRGRTGIPGRIGHTVTTTMLHRCRYHHSDAPSLWLPRRRIHRRTQSFRADPGAPGVPAGWSKRAGRAG